MKKLFLFCFVIFQGGISEAQLSVKYNPALQPTHGMQYFTPAGTNLFVGDCIPFYHDGTYYLYWLLDSAHHSALNGLGGHQWALSTTKDLKHWTHYPIVIGIDEDWEKSICTGSVAYFKNKYYAFYATRLLSKDGKVEQLSYAISNDGIHFKKQKPNPFYKSAPGYSTRDFRDPKVLVDSSGAFHLFVSSKKNNPALQGMDGALVHVASKDLKNWEVKGPLLTGQSSVPECPDYFYWNGWYYLIYGDRGDTFYVKSQSRYGPWQQPQYQTLKEEWSNVVKTGEFINGRRIAAAWIPSRRDNKDNGNEIFGGSAVFREVVQEEDGTLSTKFPPEMIPKTGTPLELKLMYDSLTTVTGPGSYLISSPGGVGAAHFENVPENSRITLEIEPLGDNEEYGLYLRANEKAAGGYRLNLSQNDKTVALATTRITAVNGLNNNVRIDIIMKNDIIDVCVDNRRCIINRLSGQKGSFLWIYAKHGYVKFKSIVISPIK